MGSSVVFSYQDHSHKVAEKTLK